MFGLLNINKPHGVTSRDVVNRVQRLVRPAKTGHAGTLDPLACGVLVVCVGPATRLTEYVQGMTKQYTGTFLLGRTSDTEDIEGEVVELPDPPRPTPQEIVDVLRRFVGRFLQRPPAFSAKKVAGRRAYKLARQGKTFELAPKEVTVHDVQLVDYDYPELTLNVTCGSGTYIRSLGRDIGHALGTAAVMSALTRTAVGDYRLDQACTTEDLTRDTIAQYLLPPLTAVASLPTLRLTDEQTSRIANGVAIDAGAHVPGKQIAALDKSGNLIAILVPRGRGLAPVRYFPPPTGTSGFPA